jgi:hypothetical protein
MRFERHYLLSLEERLGVHLSAIDSDYDHRKCDDRVTTVQKMRNMVNRLETHVRSMPCWIAFILGRGFGMPRSLSIRLP